MGAETERCSRHDGFYPKQTDLYRQFFIIRTSFVRKVLNICPLLPFQAPKNSLYIFWKWDSLMPISPYIKFKSWTVKLELYSIRSKRSTNTSYIICYFIFWLKFSGHLLGFLRVTHLPTANHLAHCYSPLSWLNYQQFLCDIFWQFVTGTIDNEFQLEIDILNPEQFLTMIQKPSIMIHYCKRRW